MTSKEFTIWLKGFTDGVHEYNITPKQWDLLKEKLEQVSDEPKIGTPIGEGGWGTPNTTPVWQHPHYIDPYHPYKITCQPGTTLTTTPGSGSISIANPYIASFGTVTSTTYGYPSGSSWSYTNSNQPFSTQTDDDLKSKKTKKK